MPAYRTRHASSRSLDVTPDTPETPTLEIISPTPRAFTFPVRTTGSSPSPSPSPFQGDTSAFSFPNRGPTPLSFDRSESPADSLSSNASSTYSTYSVESNYSVESSSSFGHKRRGSSQSTCSDISVASNEPRRPKKGDGDYIKRPENAFILFRRKCCEERKELLQQEEESAGADGIPNKRQRQADLSKTISLQWKSLAPEDRAHWEELAKEKKREHEKMYPDYVYRPQRSKGRGKKSGKGKATDYDDQSYTDSESAPFVLSAPPVFLRGHSRSSSAPTPAAGQYGIQLPTVYMPSCPSSPAMMPIQQTRRKSRPSHLHESMTQFDFLDEDLIPPFGDSNEYQGSLSINEGFNFGMPSGAPEYRDRDGGFRSLSINTNFDNRHSLYPQHHISPAGTNMHSSCSTSSGRSSPYRSPYTPQTMPGTLPEQDLQGQLRDMEIQYGNEQAAAWREQEEMLWPQDIVDVQGCNDEFDPLSGGIPALTLGLPAFEEDEYEFIQAAAASSSLYEARPFSEDREMQLPPQDFERDTFSSMFAFDDMDMMDPSASQDSDRF